MRHHRVDHAHPVRRLGVVGVAEEEDLPGELLADLAGQVGRAESAVEAGDVGVGLLEPRVLAAGQGQVADDVQAVPAARRPAGHHADDDLGHEPDEPLHLEDVQPSAARRVDGLAGLPFGVAVAVPAADPLVAAGAEGPPAVLRRGAVAGQQHAAHVGGHPGVVERGVQLVHGVRAEGVADLGPVERHADGAGVHRAVVGDVGEGEPADRAPALRIEDLRNHGPHCGRPGTAARGQVTGQVTVASTAGRDGPPRAVMGRLSVCMPSGLSCIRSVIRPRR